MLRCHSVSLVHSKLPVCWSCIRWLSGGKHSSKKASTNSWMKRHMQDPFVRQAQREGEVNRSFYKLEQMDQRHNLLSKRSVVVELGAAPGGWTSYVARRLAKGSTLVAIDLLPLDPVVVKQVSRAPIDCHVLQGDFRSTDVQEKLRSILKNNKVSLVLSDMATNTIGDSQTDALRTMGLCETALDMAMELLCEQGVFVAKYFSCSDEVELRNHARQYFDKVQVVKPPASRKESAERYLMAKGYHGP